MGTAFPFLKEKNHVVSIIGGGGKTTLLYEMAGFCVKNDQKVLVTTSTHIYRPPKEWHDQSLEAVERKFQHRPRSDYRECLPGSGKAFHAGNGTI